MTLILVHLEEFQNKHALIRISLADYVKLKEDSKKHGFDKFTASDENDVVEVFCSDCDEIFVVFGMARLKYCRIRNLQNK